MKGRRPKSLADLESGGTFRKDRHAHLVGAGATGLPSLSGPPPDELDEHGAAEWTRVVAAVQPGHLTEAERALVIGYCFWYGLFVRAAGELAGRRLPEAEDEGRGRGGRFGTRVEVVANRERILHVRHPYRFSARIDPRR